MTNTTDIAIKTTYLSIVGNFLLALIKGIVGYFGNSYALMADAIESTSDIFSSIMVLFGLKYATTPADSNHPYGHGRAEPLVTFIVVGFLVASAAIIAYESIQKILSPHPLPQAYTLWVLLGVIIIKELFYRFVTNVSEKTNSGALKADAWHHRSDVITSAVAFVGISIALIMGKGYETADDWAALIASGIILYNSYKIFRPALSEIMDEHLYDDMVVEIREIASKVEGIKGTEKCYIRKTGMQYYVDLHAAVDANLTVREGHDLAHKLKDALQTALPQIAYVLIHVEPSER